MSHGVCFRPEHVGVWASRGLGADYLWNRLRDLVDLCWLKTATTEERNTGELLVARMDGMTIALRMASPAQTQALIDQALEFIQKHTSEGLEWRISNGELVLREINPRS